LPNERREVSLSMRERHGEERGGGDKRNENEPIHDGKVWERSKGDRFDL